MRVFLILIIVTIFCGVFINARRNNDGKRRILVGQQNPNRQKVGMTQKFLKKVDYAKKYSKKIP